MQRFRFPVLAFCLAVAVLVCLAGRAFTARVGDGNTPNDTIRQKLSMPVSVDFDEMPLNEVLDYFRRECDINIVYDPPEYETADRMVNLNVRNMEAATALRWVTTLTQLDSDVFDGVLYVSTADRVARMGAAYMQQYDVRDLLAAPAALRNSRNGNNDNDDDDDNDNDNDGDDDDGSPAEELLQLLTLFTGPENWDHVEVLGVNSSDDNTESESREDDF